MLFLPHFRHARCIGWRLGVFLVLSGVFLGCDTAPGPSDPLGRPPALSDFAYAPGQLNLQNVDDSAIQDGTVGVDFDVQVRVRDADGAVDRVVFVLRPPTSGGQPLAFEQLEEGASGLYSLSKEVQIATGETGNYNLVVYAVDDTGLLSNEAIGTFTLINDGSPPVLDSLDVPDTITRPATGTQNVVFAAHVSDPDGLANVASVVFWNVNTPGSTFSLFDDGQSGGDDIAGDGRFTATLQISSTNAAGINRFAFQATDRAGLKSNVLEKEVTIE